MRQRIGEIISKLISSFDTSNKGFSARKLSAFTAIVLVCIVHVKWLNSDRWEYLAEILAMDYMFILTLLGFTTWQYIKKDQKIENESNDKNSDSVSTDNP